MGKGKLIEKFKKSGITASTPENMLINAAVLYRERRRGCSQGLGY